MESFNANIEESEQIIWWLVHLLGGRVTIPTDDQFWETNMPEQTRLSVDHDSDGNPVLVAEALVWDELK